MNFNTINIVVNIINFLYLLKISVRLYFTMNIFLHITESKRKCVIHFIQKFHSVDVFILGTTESFLHIHDKVSIKT